MYALMNSFPINLFTIYLLAIKNFKINLFKFRLVFVGCLILFISACNHLQKPEKIKPTFDASWQNRQDILLSINHWQAIGKLAIKTADNGGSSSLNWLQSDADYQIDLVGPLGQGKLTIKSSNNFVTLTEAGQNPVSAKSAEELLVKTTGWHIPVTELAFWMRALPAPQSTINSMTANTLGQLGELKQSGWTITYADFVMTETNPGSQQLMPRRIIAQYQTEKTKVSELKLTLVVREWKFNP